MVYRAIYLEQKYNFFENSDLYMTFVIYKDNELITDFTNYQFKCEITDGAEESQLKDASQDGGSADQISATGAKIIVHSDHSNHDEWEGEFTVELELVTPDGDIFTVYQGLITFNEEEVDW